MIHVLLLLFNIFSVGYEDLKTVYERKLYWQLSEHWTLCTCTHALWIWTYTDFHLVVILWQDACHCIYLNYDSQQFGNVCLPCNHSWKYIVFFWRTGWEMQLLLSTLNQTLTLCKCKVSQITLHILAHNLEVITLLLSDFLKILHDRISIKVLECNDILNKKARSI